MALPVPVAVGGLVTATAYNALIPLVFYVREEQPANTPGGGLTAGTWTKRALNTIALNEIGAGASLTSNVVTLPAGTYTVDGEAAGFSVAPHKLRLRQTSGTPADLAIGVSAYNLVASQVQTTARVRGRIVLTGSTTLELQHNVGTTKTVNGAGVAGNLGVNELYADLMFTKIG